MNDRIANGRVIFTLCNVISTSDKHYDLKIVGKPCEGKPHARFDEGLLGRLKAAPAAYSTVSSDTSCEFDQKY